MSCLPEISGLNSIAFYVNDGVELKRPDPNVENEVDLIQHLGGSVVIEYPDKPKWSRKISYSGNYRQVYQDKFSFFLFGIENDTPDILTFLRSQRKGFITEIITQSNQSFVFPSPVFVSEIYEKKEDIRTWEVVLTYRQPTFKNRLKKLNTLLMVHSYILTGGSNIMGSGDFTPIVSN